MDSFHAKAIQAVRQVDQKHIIFLEPGNINSFKISATNIVWSPHFYQLAYTRRYYPENFTLLKLDFETKYETFAVNLKKPNVDRGIWSFHIRCDKFNDMDS